MKRERPTNYDAEDALRLTGERLALWRRLQRLTQEQVAQRAGISRSTLTRLEAGDGGVSLETFYRVLTALHIDTYATDALDPLRTDLGQARAEAGVPLRVRRHR